MREEVYGPKSKSKVTNAAAAAMMLMRILVVDLSFLNLNRTSRLKKIWLERSLSLPNLRATKGRVEVH